MNRTGTWLGRAGAAAGWVSDRPPVWLYGTLAALPLLAWLPLVLSVTPPVRMSDLAFFGAALMSSSLFPWNVVGLAVGATVVMLIAAALAAIGEAGLLEWIDDREGHRPRGREIEVAFSVLTAASLPAIAVLAILASVTAAVAPTEFELPDTSGPLWLRLLGDLGPILALLTVVVVASQAVGASALRRAIGPHCQSISASLRDGLRDVAREPVRLLGLAIASAVADVLAFGLTLALLHVLWAPIGPALAAGPSPRGLLLLVGFVAIWLATVMAVGVLRAWVATWWSLELRRELPEPRRETEEAHP